MRDRIFGIECEYGIVVPPTSGAERSSALAAAARRIIPRRSVTDVAPHGCWLPDGARAYVDYGDHPETATPECLSPAEAVAHDTAAMLWLDARRVAVEAELQVPISVHRDNGPLSNPYASWGVHENYLTERDLEPAAIATTVGTHLGTRVVLFGAGRAAATASGFDFELSARHRVIDRVLSGSSTSGRPLVHTRDESHADHRRWRRLHVICGDAYLDRDALDLQLASTHLVLRLAEEHPEVLAPLAVADPLEVFHRSSATTDLSTLHVTVEGAKVTALDVQAELATAAFTHLDLDPGGWELAAAQRWLQWVDDARTGGTETLAGRAPWVSKLQLLEQLEGRFAHLDQEARAVRLAAFDAAFTEIGEDRGWWWRVEGMTGDHLAAARAAASTPPVTRARVRDQLIAALERSGVPYASAWSDVTVNGDTVRLIRMPDPFCADSASIRKHLEAIEGLPAQHWHAVE